MIDRTNIIAEKVTKVIKENAVNAVQNNTELNKMVNGHVKIAPKDIHVMVKINKNVP